VLYLYLNLSRDFSHSTHLLVPAKSVQALALFMNGHGKRVIRMLGKQIILIFFSNKYAQEQTCSECYGKRLNKLALAVSVGNADIFELGNKSVKDLLEFLKALKLTESETEIGSGLIKEIVTRLKFLNDVGLSYLSFKSFCAYIVRRRRSAYSFGLLRLALRFQVYCIFLMNQVSVCIKEIMIA